MLRNRVEILETILRSHHIDIDTSVAQLMNERNLFPSISSQGNSSQTEVEDEKSDDEDLDDLCTSLNGALTLDESLNFDKVSEMRYFGPTSGRLQFQTTSEG